MARGPVPGLLGCVAFLAAAGCLRKGDLDSGPRSSRIDGGFGAGIVGVGGAGSGDVGIGGAGGAPCPFDPSGTVSSGPNDFNIRGFTNGYGEHDVVQRSVNCSTITQWTGTPLANPVSLGGTLMPHSSPWAYRRHDGADVVAYIDQDGHVHERGSLDFDFALSFGINAPIAASAPADGSAPAPDIIGYMPSDNQSALVYRASNDHVIEIRSNFAGQPPWLATDLTLASGANRAAPVGSPFPYARLDGCTAIVYVGSDVDIHELTNCGSGWRDQDLTSAAGYPPSPTTDPSGYVRSDKVNAVLFVGTDGNLYELASSNDTWRNQILPASSPMGTRFHRPSGYVRPDGLNAVVYVAGEIGSQSVHEITFDGGWSDALVPGTSTGTIGQPFAHRAPGNRSSILFSGTDRALGLVSRYEASRPLAGSWSVQQF